MPSQQVTMGPAPMERVERMNVVVVRGQEQGQSMGFLLDRTPVQWK